ncbi:nodulation methyltransferase NodS [Paraburkholderia caribensis]|uniref:Nodulation protein S n=2 Tax=Paraburkholderia TaxID=1822464 RepID=B2JY94_PARP8|nr:MULTISPECIES: nodulation methyltransferase NodS [Paraburkholderia]ACC76602.1 NodS family protein [Paraburkholderia phymatum STM815]MCO4880433.1 nodulation S family protein [Paraburkholderia caribensis]PTB25822.1 methyltransferase domain-containing protein [Paraburkholderia caribensis]
MRNVTNFELLRRELDADDPWQLDSNPFELQRHEQMLRMSLVDGSVSNALEVGCAGGAFTERLAPHCQRLTIIDVMPQALSKTRERLKEPPNTVWIVSDVQHFFTLDKFDLIVVAEVLYYLGNIEEVRAAIRNLVRMLVPGGRLIFGSARDASCRRWGHLAGAETVLEILKEELTEVERVECVGESPNENCLLARFRNRAFLSPQPNYPL